MAWIGAAPSARLANRRANGRLRPRRRAARLHPVGHEPADRKSTRLNSSHSQISYAVFCLKKKISHVLFQIEEEKRYQLQLQQRFEEVFPQQPDIPLPYIQQYLKPHTYTHYQPLIDSTNNN